MAQHKSAKKRIITNEKRRQRNVAAKSRIKTYEKRVLAAVEAKDADAAKAALPTALSYIDKAASKGIIHKNTAARKKAKLQQQTAAL
ncbi:MAG TPA: 30S ribosomal protein S20 [Candidatus Hydrogenedentes bacterium]|nr:30S ribosomal protein S20 [Candidatus Hydrogenedentota bacterium]HIJ74938.1 30S ribosomal protein S20 [Candidatus Hydrogenedentota bacterium]